MTAATVENSHDTFTGDALLVKTKTAAGTGFDMISAKANNVEVYKVAGDGSTTQAQGLTVTAGGATVTGGGLKVSDGGSTFVTTDSQISFGFQTSFFRWPNDIWMSRMNNARVQ